MATYCVSDIHGMFSSFYELLELIGFSQDDEMWVLGDIIDRGNESADLLVWAVDNAPANIHFLAGNHEDFARSVVADDPEGLPLDVSRLWAANYGRETVNVLMVETDGAWRRERLLPWLTSLLPYHYLEVGGKPFMLVHAGFEPSCFDGGFAAAPPAPYEEIEHCWEALSDHSIYDVGHGFGEQYAQHMLWARDRWIYWPGYAPCDVVFGHTCIHSWRFDRLREMDCPGFAGESGRIVHAYNRHGIDCAAAYADKGWPFTCHLAALRLDDMEEFYVATPKFQDLDWF